MSWQLQSQADELRAAGLWRELRQLDTAQGSLVQVAGRELVNFSSNDYLGLADSACLRQALMEGIQRYGTGAGASRLICGTMQPHLELEAALADFKGTEAALTFSSGYATALGTLPALLGPGDTLILDKLCHASLLDAARLSGATIRIFPHHHLGKLERLLATAKGRTLIVTEAVFSMDGDLCPLAEIIALKEQYGAWLLLDEAHSVGVLGPQGRGLAAELGLESRVELQMGTLSKAIGLSGGYLAASRLVIELLINRARSLIYSTAPPPSLAHAACAALSLIRSAEGDQRRDLLKKNVLQLTSASRFSSAIIPHMIGDETRAMQASSQLRDEGYLIPAIRYPTVARGSARLRITCSASHSPEQISALQAALAKI